MKQAGRTLLSPLYRGGNQGSEKWHDLKIYDVNEWQNSDCNVGFLFLGHTYSSVLGTTSPYDALCEFGSCVPSLQVGAEGSPSGWLGKQGTSWTSAFLSPMAHSMQSRGGIHSWVLLLFPHPTPPLPLDNLQWATLVGGLPGWTVRSWKSVVRSHTSQGWAVGMASITQNLPELPP